MPELMLFKPVIDAQGLPFTAIKRGEGDYVAGEWVEGEPIAEECTGVILPLVAGSKNVGESLTYSENGVYSLKDRKLLTVEILTAGTEVSYKGNRYTIQDYKDFSDYTDVQIYIMRWRGK